MANANRVFLSSGIFTDKRNYHMKDCIFNKIVKYLTSGSSILLTTSTNK